MLASEQRLNFIRISLYWVVVFFQPTLCSFELLLHEFEFLSDSKLEERCQHILFTGSVDLHNKRSGRVYSKQDNLASKHVIVAANFFIIKQLSQWEG